MKVKMTSNRPQIFRASDAPEPPKLPLDNKVNDDWTDNEICPSCKKSFADHNPRKIVKCALAQLQGRKS